MDYEEFNLFAFGEFYFSARDRARIIRSCEIKSDRQLHPTFDANGKAAIGSR